MIMKIQKTYKTKYGRCAIIEKLNGDKILVEFLQTGYRTVTTKSHLIRNEVKDYLSKSVFNVGLLC